MASADESSHALLLNSASDPTNLDESAGAAANNATEVPSPDEADSPRYRSEPAAALFSPSATCLDPDSRLSYVCQRCLLPLRIDESFYGMNEHTLAELTLRVKNNPEFGVTAADVARHNSELLRRRNDGAGGGAPDDDAPVDVFVPPYRMLDSAVNALVSANPTTAASAAAAATASSCIQPNNSFTLVDESGAERAVQGGLSRKLRMTADLFDLISSNGEYDHPMCEECTDSLLEAMNQDLMFAEAEAQEYQAYLQQLEREREDDGQAEQLAEELAQLQLEEKQLQEELVKINEETKLAEQELQEQKDDEAKLEADEAKYWKEYSTYKRELLLAEDEYTSLNNQLSYAQGQLDKLKKLNVFNATFHIWHTGHFATINGFRLGRLPSMPVDWHEINAAWGQTALLLTCLAKAVGMEGFQRYQIVPYGNFSYVKSLHDDKVLPLYGTGGFRMIFDSKFDSGMVAFLDCLQQFATVVQDQGRFSLPYQMEKGKIRDRKTDQFYSIKLQFNSEEAWTKALRFTLINLKWGLAYVSTKCMQQEVEEAQSA